MRSEKYVKNRSENALPPTAGTVISIIDFVVIIYSR